MKLTTEQAERLRTLTTNEDIKAFFETEGIELGPEDLEAAAGGYIISGGYFGMDKVYDDATGERLGSAYAVNQAKALAQSLGVSDTYITREQYQALFGKTPE